MRERVTDLPTTDECVTDRAGSAGAQAPQSAAAGIAVMCLGVLSIVANDTAAKWLTQFYDPLQVMFMRNITAVPMILAVVLMVGGRPALRSRHAGLHAVRGILLVGAAYTFFSGIQVLPLAEATALVFAAPIFITALSVPLLREHVGWRRWAAAVVGFIGVLIVVRPGAEAFQAASLLPVASAAFYALIMISARWIDRAEGLWTMMLYVALFPALFSGLGVPLVWQTPDWAHLPYVLGMAVFGTLGLTLISQAFRLAPAAVVAPFDYTALIWASLFGWLVWAEVPVLWTWLGAAVIVASGIFIVFRETRQERARR